MSETMTGLALRVLICDRLPLVRDGIRLGLRDETDIQIVGATGSGAEALALARRACPDVVVIDPELPGLSAAELVRRLRAEPLNPPPKVLVLSVRDDDTTVLSLLERGATGFLIKGSSAAQLAEAIRAVHAGEAVLAPRVTRRVLDWCFLRTPRPDQPVPVQISGLTTRERQVLQLIARGLTTREVARELRVGEVTVRTHTYRMQQKLELQSRSQLVSFACRSGLAPGD